MMKEFNTVMILKDNTFIDNIDSLTDYLVNLGFNIQDLKNCLCAEEYDRIKMLQNSQEDYEREADAWYRSTYDMAAEIHDLANKLATGKGGTKIAYADRFHKIADYYAQ